MSDNVTATFREVGGQLVLDDPIALAVMRGVGRANCANTVALNHDRISYFAGRMATLNKSPDEFVIVILNVDDPNGEVVAEVLMPGHDWDQIRSLGQVPFARGLASRKFIHDCLDIFDTEARDQLDAMKGLIVAVVVDHGVAVIVEC